MVESESDSGSQQSTPPPSSASGETVTPAGQKKVKLFEGGKFVESGRILPWLMLAAVISTLTWVVMDAWSRTWQEVEVNQTSIVPPNRSGRRPSAFVDTSTWKTYRNEKYGFEVKYPTAWSITKLNSDDAIIEVASVNDEKYLPPSVPPRGEMWISVAGRYLSGQCEGKEEEKVIKDYFGSQPIKEEIWQISKCFFSYQMEGTQLEINGRVWTDDSLFVSHQELVKSIVSSFSVTSDLARQLDTTQWLTYRNEQYGYQFEYPDRWVATSPNYVVRVTGLTTNGKKIPLNMEIQITDSTEKFPETLELYKDEIKRGTNEEEFQGILKDRFQEVRVSGQRAYQVEADFLGFGSIVTAFQIKNKRGNILLTYAAGIEKDAKRLNDLFISTFKFIE
ncbi:hypothetical protein HYW67_02855 [Candidatus Parcubacteria bacterium]|nr:hypothetical protein [Candidatus Parcubacteria bacterium]